MQTKETKDLGKIDILVLPENKQGEDYLVGDIHGSPMIFAILQMLTEHDRLFIVGDLTDRGTHSAAIVFGIINHNNERLKKGLPPQIYSVQGNHEVLFLNYHDDQDDTVFLPCNGGEWIKSTPKDQLESIAEFFYNLPFIIHVEGENGFNIVHADMPFDDDELIRRINAKNFTLTDKEIDYAIWARTIARGNDPAIKDTGRTANSRPTYCGHMIGQGVRKETNHIDLDMGTYFSFCICIVAHISRQVGLRVDAAKQEMVSKDLEMGFNKSPIAIANEIAQHLQSLKKSVIQKQVPTQPEVKKPNKEEVKFTAPPVVEKMDTGSDSKSESTFHKRKLEEKTPEGKALVDPPPHPKRQKI